MIVNLSGPLCEGFHSTMRNVDNVCRLSVFYIVGRLRCVLKSCFSKLFIFEGLYTQCRGRAPASGQNVHAGMDEALPLEV